MTRRLRTGLIAVAALAVLTVLAVVLVARRGASRVPAADPDPAAEVQGTIDGAALVRLRSIPFYRALAGSSAVRSCTLDPDGALHVDVDLRAWAQPRLAAAGWPDVCGLLPAVARGTIALASAPGVSPAVLAHESWIFSGRETVFTLLDHAPSGPFSTSASEAIPGTPAALVRIRLVPKRLADPSFGGAALAAWRERADAVEQLLGRPIREEIAEDLAGPAVFALYETPTLSEAEAVATFELKRSDRLAGLLDTLFGLGALTERATVRRYRGVATGSFIPASGGAGLALAVDGATFIVASTRARLESAIDARRAPVTPDPDLRDAADLHASWSAVTRSAFVGHGWSKLARLPEPNPPDVTTTEASIIPEGTDVWRLESRGQRPAITADPIVPFLRSVFARGQRDGG